LVVNKANLLGRQQGSMSEVGHLGRSFIASSWWVADERLDGLEVESSVVGLPEIQTDRAAVGRMRGIYHGWPAGRSSAMSRVQDSAWRCGARKRSAGSGLAAINKRTGTWS
jgi:hypothetical protein